METKITKPEIVTEAHLQFLDELRESGETNMFGARPYLIEAFDPPPSKEAAAIILRYWMQSFGERHPNK